MSTREVRVAKIGLYFALFVTEIYIFLISSKNSQYSPRCNIVSTLWIPMAYNTSFQNAKVPRTYYVLRKVKRYTGYKTWDCNSGTKDLYIFSLSCLINNHYGFWKLSFGHRAKSRIKFEKSLKCISNSLYLLRENL